MFYALGPINFKSNTFNMTNTLLLIADLLLIELLFKQIKLIESADSSLDNLSITKIYDCKKQITCDNFKLAVIVSNNKI